MNAKEREIYWKKVERLRRSIDEKYTLKFAQAIKSDLDFMAGEIRKYGPSAFKTMMGAYVWNEKLILVMNELYREVAIKFGNASYRAVRNMSLKATDPFGLNNTWLGDLLSFLTKWGFQLAIDMTNTTKRKVDAIITQGLAEGWSTDMIVEQIRKDEEIGYSAMRARRIARTEVMRSSNYAAYVGAGAHGFEVDKIWISSRDNRTRRIPRNSYDHFDMDGKTVAYKESFTSFGKKGDVVVADFPGDPQAPAGFTVNCRCTIGFIPKRDEFGRLIPKA